MVIFHTQVYIKPVLEPFALIRSAATESKPRATLPSAAAVEMTCSSVRI